MTQESPELPKRPSGIVCDECGLKLVVARNNIGGLIVSCGCDEVRTIKVASALPEGWSV